MAAKKVGARNYLTLSFVAAIVVGVVVWGGVRDLVESLIWAGVTFIVALVGIATLALSVKDQDSDPNKPLLK